MIRAIKAFDPEGLICSILYCESGHEHPFDVRFWNEHGEEYWPEKKALHDYTIAKDRVYVVDPNNPNTYSKVFDMVSKDCICVKRLKF